MRKIARKTVIRYCAVLAFAAVPPLSLGALTLEDAMNAALQADSSLADAKSALTIAENNLFRSAPLYGSSLSVGATVKGSGDSDSPVAPGSSGSEDTQKSMTASLALPLARWLSLSLSGTTDLETASQTLAITFSPLAKPDSSAETALKRAVLQASSALRNSMLSVRREYRAVLTAKAEYEAKKAAVRTSQNALSKIQYLVELGKSRKSEEINAYSDLMDAQGALDTAENNLSSAVQSLALRTGLELTTEGEYTPPPENSERTLADLQTWLDRSADLLLARLALDSETLSARQSVSLPDLSVGATVDDSASWSVTAKVSLSPEVFFQKASSSAGESLAVQRRAYAAAEQNAKTAFANQQSALSMALRNYENAQRFVESAGLSHTETKLMLERGEASQADLDSAAENLLAAQYQLAKASESLENARDQLDTAWQLPLE